MCIRDRVYSDYSMDFDRLSLNSAEEKAILFYTSMSYFGNKYNIIGRNGCRGVKEFGDKMPLFEGKRFFEYKIPNFEAFDINFGQVQGKRSFIGYYGKSYELAIETHKKCN